MKPSTTSCAATQKRVGVKWVRLREASETAEHVREHRLRIREKLTPGRLLERWILFEDAYWKRKVLRKPRRCWKHYRRRQFRDATPSSRAW